MKSKIASPWQLFTLFGAFCVVFLLLIISAFKLQLLGSSKLDRLAERQLIREVVKLPKRGDILDRTGQPLAMSIRVKSLYANPKQIGKNKKTFAQKIGNVLGVSPKIILSRLDPNKEFIWLKRHLKEETVQQIDRMEINGIGFVEEDKRIYPGGVLGAHVVGFTNIDGVGIEGIEKHFDQRLSGIRETAQFRLDGRGRLIYTTKSSMKTPLDGENLSLTLDSSVQHQAEEVLKDAIIEHQAKDGSAVVLDVLTGEVVALVSYPFFDPNYSGISAPDTRRNRAFVDTYEPGSTLKPILVAGALESKIYNENSRLFCENGKFKVGDRIISEADAHHSFGLLSISDVIKNSSNICSAKIALRMGADSVTKIYKNFGFGAVSLKDIPGEGTGKIAVPAKINKVLLANMGFGQGLSINVMQLAAAYQTIANGGVAIRPRLVKGLPIESRQVVSPETAKSVREMLEKVTEEGGTGVKARVEGYRIAGKTGTAQKVDRAHKTYSSSKYFASFAGFVPAEKPRFVIAVVVNEPGFPYYGGEVAAPAFQRIANFLLIKEGISPQNPVILTLRPEVKTRTVASKPNVEESSVVSQSSMPNLLGMSLRESLELVRDKGKRVLWEGSGIVVGQNIPAGTQLLKNEVIELKLAAP